MLLLLLRQSPPSILLVPPTRTSDRMSGNLFNGLFWLLVLVLLSWWVACLCFFPYVVCSVLTPCIPALKPLADILLKGVSFPAMCSDNMVNQRSYNSH